MEKQKISMIIFDMDGVLLDSEPLHENARQSMFRKYGIDPGDDLPDPVGKSSSGFWRIVMERYGIQGDPYLLEKEQYHLVAEQIRDNHVQPSDGLVELLDMARSSGIKIGLASSSTRVLVDDTLRLLGIKDYFDYTVSGDEVAAKKPKPDVYLKVLELSQCAPQEACAVEDSHAGVVSAQSAGIFCYGYRNDTSGGQDISSADRIIENLREIMI